MPRTVDRRIPALPTDLPAGWHGAATWTSSPDGQQPWRVRPEHLEQIMSAEMEELSRIPNGVRLEVETDASVLEIALTSEPAPEDPVPCADVVVDGSLADTVPIEGRTSARIELPGTLSRVELWLPHAAPTSVTEVGFRGASHLAPAGPRGPRWAVYGSSITQCNQAASPTGTWPALVAAQNSWELTALGMSGQCHLDPPLAETIGAARPDLVTVCLGANIYGAATFTARSLPPTVIGFLTHVRRLVDGPIVVMSPTAAGAHREEQPNAAGLDQRDVREIVHRCVRSLQRRDPLLSLIDGTEIVSTGEMDLLGDLLHPTAEGYRVMAERLAPRLAEVARDRGARTEGVPSSAAGTA
ncbi:hypothetical protein BH708_15520 [Brachybacterium sp. P6-10-X1]|uniref:GDSL-type esterase/lipase family protein n=1 Tax=Brachybacterium sp. P6-10-X1 TaxID=1903186 RepID=UPI000971A588|nr:GDSL-type esterase/lipase family protein [Brachybacterium sp. P6-10-X1]APX33886.1 hypothetical protein BH708_15520 [Brachybacterium sp. P6-10-X1]